MGAARQATSVVIATTPRSGSWLLAEGLRSLGCAGRPEEFFRADLEPLYRRRFQLAPDAPFDEFVSHVLEAGCTDNRVFAMKVHWFQFSRLLSRLRALSPSNGGCEAELMRLFFGDVRLVYLERGDTLRQAISWYRAMVTDVWWHERDAPGPRHFHPVAFDFESVKHLYYLLLEYKAAWRDWCARAELPVLTMKYESLAANYEAAVARVLRFAGLPQPAVISPPALQRQSDPRTEVWVGEYERVWRALFAQPRDGRPAIQPH